ncbi:CheR family methyltransferase [Marinisporobacter balticus]|uniref:protein-glutamate O-methyltransferase n=1 Tax=Marinisporobacter balticus TaxID=2018667 RepID=A0A4R2KIU2_9FIRM|nr:protein-glutamate O-methyltransferase CheR [Marinisporobacter balticus]TCO73134.1 chemotaxis protein methyltransferase CheR [Marinisporobacter balticus]
MKITHSEFMRFVVYVKENFGINLMHKKALILGRLQNHLIQNQFQNFSQYIEYIMIDHTGAAVKNLLNKLTTNHTYFMRETEHFDYYKKIILPELFVKERKTKDLRIWSAGCSSGEEAYTLAMIQNDFLGDQKKLWDAKILATDISDKVLTAAVNGIYLNEKLVHLPEKWKKNYFEKIDYENSKVIDAIRNEVIFRRFNLMNKIFPFKKKFHVIFCRNVMIYFDAATKKALINRFYEFTESGGYLFIGHSESINREETAYKYIMPAVYRKE